MLGGILVAAVDSPFSTILGYWRGASISEDGSAQSESAPSISRPPFLSEHQRSSSDSHSRNASNSQPYEIWHPPTEQLEPEEGSELSPEAQAANDWRQYPAFPSAYPASPISTTRSALPTGNMFIQPPTFAVAMNQPDFRQSLMHEPESPRSEAGMSDDLLLSPGARGIFSEEEMSGDSDQEYEEEDEDVFNTTLKTPPPARPRNLSAMSGPGSNRNSIGSVLAGLTYAPKPSAENVIGMKRQHSSTSSLGAESATLHGAVPMIRRVSSSNGTNDDDDSATDEDQDVEGEPNLPPLSPKKRKVINGNVNSGPNARAIGSKAIRPTQAGMKAPSAKAVPARKPIRPLSDASTRNSNTARQPLATEKPTRPLTQRRNPSITAKRKENI
jgi:hypothetical protein